MLWLFAGCDLLASLDTELLISNDADRPVTVDVIAGVTPVWSGELQAGASHRARFTPEHDSAFSVTATRDGKKAFEVIGIGYTTPNDGQRLHMHVGTSSAVLDDAAAHGRSRVQRVLDDPGVKGFLHLEVPANRPLTIDAPRALQQESLRVHAGGEAVKFQEGGRLRLALDGDDVTVSIPDEGVVGRASFTRGSDGWTVPTVSLAEQ